MTETKDNTGLLRDKDWDFIDGELLHITNFHPMGNSKIENGAVVSPVKSMPYAVIEFECNGKNLSGFITHKLDFQNLWEADQLLKEHEGKFELIAYWTRRHYKGGLVSGLFSKMSGPFPKMIIMLCPKGKYASHANFKIEEEKIMVYVYALMTAKHWVPDVIRSS